jgi:hypothetical protein
MAKDDFPHTVTIDFHQLTFGSLCKIGVICNLFVWCPFGLFMGFAGIAGYDVVELDGEPVTGLAALLTALGVSMAFAILGGIVIGIGGIIARFVNRWVSFGGVRYTEDDNP